jgi:hypothetical protein
LVDLVPLLLLLLLMILKFLLAFFCCGIVSCGVSLLAREVGLVVV